jgi:hypothetical protein
LIIEKINEGFNSFNFKKKFILNNLLEELAETASIIYTNIA